MPLPILAAAIPVGIVVGRIAGPKLIRLGTKGIRKIPGLSRGGVVSATTATATTASVVIPPTLRTGGKVLPYAAAGGLGFAAGRKTAGANVLPGFDLPGIDLPGGRFTGSLLVLGALAGAGYLVYRKVKK